MGNNNIDTISNDKKDLIISMVLFPIILYTLITADAFKLIVNFVQKYENYELDDIVLATSIAGFLGLWYSIRRYNEIESINSKIQSVNESMQEEVKEKTK